MNTMSKEELRIEIALKLGAHVVGLKGRPDSQVVITFYQPRACELVEGDFSREDIYFDEIPDYPNDIKAAYELEGSVPKELMARYATRLCHITENFDLPDDLFNVLHANAEQRCRAYLMTMRTSNNGRALPIP